MSYLHSIEVWIGIGLTTILNLLIMVVLIPNIVLQKRDSAATFAWILCIVFLPLFGLMLYWVFGATRLQIRRRKRRRFEALLAPTLENLVRASIKPAEAELLAANAQLLPLARRLDGVGPIAGNQVALYRDGGVAFEAMSAAIRGAAKHIHIIYYTWEADETGAWLRDCLVQAAQRGVEVRVLVDDVGSRLLPSDFFYALSAAGGVVRRFLPVNLFSRQFALNYRNHRKLIVVDSQHGFTGGMNVGDQYAGKKGLWRDAHVRVSGPAVLSLQEIFCQDWFHAVGEDLALPRYFEPPTATGSNWVQCLASGPADRRWRSIHTLLFTAVTLARERVWMETPYFVPDEAMLLALQSAALRGVDVRLLLPGNSDHPLVLYAGRSYYAQLLAAGVRIFETKLAMLHAKTAAIDGVFSTVGSSNLDQRSFLLNFEANAFFYGAEMAKALENSFVALQAEARELNYRRFAKGHYLTRLAEAGARVLAPVL